LELAIATRPGQIVAMNCGLSATNADIVCFTDDDCVPRAEWLSRLLSHYDDTSVGGVGGRDVVHLGEEICDSLTDDVGRITWWGRVIGNHHLRYEGDPLTVHHLKGANMSFRRSLMKPFDERMSGGSCCLNDTDASLHVASQGYDLIYDPAAMVDHFPAERFGASTRTETDPHLVYSDSHNWIYCLLKYFSGVRKCALLMYALLIGSGNRHGVGKWLVSLRQGPRIGTQLLAASTRGKLAGVHSYLRRQQQNGSGDGDADSDRV
jgi:glycosyltransferase involved in cell wall biosynthesis